MLHVWHTNVGHTITQFCSLWVNHDTMTPQRHATDSTNGRTGLGHAPGGSKSGGEGEAIGR